MSVEAKCLRHTCRACMLRTCTMTPSHLHFGRSRHTFLIAASNAVRDVLCHLGTVPALRYRGSGRAELLADGDGEGIEVIRGVVLLRHLSGYHSVNYSVIYSIAQ